MDDPTPKATNSSTPCGQKPSAARWAPRLVSAHCCNKAKKRPASVSMMQCRCSFVFCKHAACLGGPKCRPPKTIVLIMGTLKMVSQSWDNPPVTNALVGHVSVLVQGSSRKARKGAPGSRAMSARTLQRLQGGVVPRLGYHFGSPLNKDYRFLGSTFWSPYCGKITTSCRHKLNCQR